MNFINRDQKMLLRDLAHVVINHKTYHTCNTGPYKRHNWVVCLFCFLFLSQEIFAVRNIRHRTIGISSWILRDAVTHSQGGQLTPHPFRTHLHKMLTSQLSVLASVQTQGHFFMLWQFLKPNGDLKSWLSEGRVALNYHHFSKAMWV